MDQLLGQDEEDNILDPSPADATPVAAPTPIDSQDLLRAFLTRNTNTSQQLRDAQEATNKNLLAARLTQAGANIGSSIARSKPADQKPFEDLARASSLPMDMAEKQVENQNKNSQLLQDYFSKNQANQLNRERVDAYKERTGAVSDRADRRLDISAAGLGLRQGNQAAQAADKFRSDKVMMTTSNQGQQLDKALGRIADIKAGRAKFTTSMKADLEKDLANVISGGTSSSLGQLDRIEFNPFVAKWQSALDKMNGYQGDINAPGYLAQLEQTFSGLKHDIAGIQARRAKYIGDTLGTAYSNNKLASKAIQNNVDMNAQAAKTTAPKNPQLEAAQKWLKENPNHPKAAEVKAKIEGMLR